jgi:hypothetical protein
MDCAALVSQRNELNCSPTRLSVMNAANALRIGCQQGATHPVNVIYCTLSMQAYKVSSLGSQIE